MASGRVQIYDGKRLIVGGKAATCEDDCCDAKYKLTPCFPLGSLACGKCDANTTPEHMTAILSGITWCVGCQTDGAHSYKWTTPPPDINSTYLLTQVGGSACEWEYWFAASGTIEIYTDVACAVLDQTISFVKIRVSAFFDAGGWLWVNVAGYDALNVEQFLMFLSADVAPNADCRLIDSAITDVNNCTTNMLDNHGHAAGATARVLGGDQTVGSRCPGGTPYYTNTELAGYVGKTVEISEDPGLCYTVSLNADAELSDGNATVTNCWSTCKKCCDEDAEDC